jgi:hypothetical protein
MSPGPHESLLHLEAQLRRGHFVGRDRELAAFCEALDAPGARIFYVYGPAGVGKTSLLQAFDAAAERCGVARDWIDARDLALSLDDVVAALDRPGAALARRALFLDTYELLRPIEPLVARELLRRADAATTIVLAGRTPPSVEWCALAVWGTGVVPIALRNLDQADALRYLERRGVADGSRLAIARFSHGHPLALAFAAEAWRAAPDREFTPDDAPDVVRELYAYLMRDVSGGPHRRALEAAAVLHTTSPTLLAPLVEDTTDDWFAWLCSLGFMVLGKRGVFPHDLARAVILAELRWRCPERLMKLTHQAQRLLAARVHGAAPDQFVREFSEFAFVLSHNPRARNLRFTVDDLWLDGMRPDDAPAIAAAVARHEGPEALTHVQQWLACQPTAFQVARSPGGAVVAFIASIRLDLATPAQLERDPIALAAWASATRRLGHTPRGPVAYGRWIMDCEVHQDPCLSMAVCTQAIGPLFFLPGFLFYFVRFDRWERWADAARLCDAELVPELAHAIADKYFQVTVQDHRGLSGVDWLLRFTSNATAQEWTAEATARTPEARDVSPLQALSCDGFADCVRDALRSLREPLLLARSPLLHCRALAERCPADADANTRAAALVHMLGHAVAALRGSALGDRWYRVLHAAYVEPMGKHEVIAPQLGLSYSTFRRLLAAGTRHVVEALWTRELA